MNGDFDYNGIDFEITENCSITRVDSQCKHSTLFITGGITSSGIVLNWVYGVKFFKD